MSRLSRLFRILYVLPLAFLAVFFFYPLLTILATSLAPGGQLDLSPLAQLLSSRYQLSTIWFTTWQAALSTALTLALALPAAYVFAKYEFRGKELLRALTTIPFVLPTVVVATAFQALLGPRGRLNYALMQVFNLEQPPINLQHTLAIILLAHIFYNYTVVLRIVGGFWANLNPRLEEAAAVLGAGRWRLFREVTLPLLTPAIAAAGLLVYVFCFTSFGVVLLLGGPRFATIEVEIYHQTVSFLNLPLAAALSLVQILFTTIMIWLYTYLQARTTVSLELRPRAATQRRPQSWRAWLGVAVNVGLMLVLLVTPLLALVERSFNTVNGYGLTYYQELGINRRGSVFFVPPVEAIRNSVGFALVTVVLAVMLGTMAALLLVRRSRPAARRRLSDSGVDRASAVPHGPERDTGASRVPVIGRLAKGLRMDWVADKLRAVLDAVFMLPLSVSAVTLGLGYIIALDEPPLNLRTSPWLIPLAHTLVALPFVVRSLLPALRSMNPTWREAAQVLGAPPWRVWLEVDLPILGRAMLVSAVFAFTISMGEFGATSLIARPDRPTMPVAIGRFLSQPGSLNRGQALAMSTLLMLVCAIGFLAIERFRVGEIGEF
jgi:thiamine transport system permease protein